LYKFIRHALVPSEAAFSSFAYTQLRAFLPITPPTFMNPVSLKKKTPNPNWFNPPRRTRFYCKFCTIYKGLYDDGM